MLAVEAQCQRCARAVGAKLEAVAARASQHHEDTMSPDGVPSTALVTVTGAAAQAGSAANTASTANPVADELNTLRGNAGIYAIEARVMRESA